MYLHCHNCNWSQDDFYGKSYNPAKYLMNWNDSLFRDKIDEPFTDDGQFIKDNGNITTREVIARNYDNYAKRIREMKWITYEAYKKDKEAGKAECPKCGSKEHFDID